MGLRRKFRSSNTKESTAHKGEQVIYIDAIHKKDEIICWTRDQDGHLDKHRVPAPYYCYRKAKNGPYKSLYGDPLSRYDFDTKSDYMAFLKDSNRLFESDIPPVYKFLSDNFYGLPDAPLNVGFYDIEAEVDLSRGEGYPMPENPYGRVNSISLYDRTTNEYHMIILPPEGESITLIDDESSVTVYTCVTEKQLLDTFSKLTENIDVLSGWNSSKFDIPYLMARAKVVYGAKKGSKFLSRDGEATYSRKAKDDFGTEYTKYSLVGRVSLDYMDLYKKFTFGERTSYSLDNICQLELGIKKLPYLGDLGELYRNDPKKFFEYSLHDARLLKKLDDKMKLVDLGKMMARRATVKYEDIFGSIRHLEHTIMNYCHFDRPEKLILPDKGKHEKEKFPGAFVMDTKAGVYGWVCSVDIGSLYPSVIRSCNISPETHAFQLEGRNDDFIKVVERSNELVSLISMDDNEVITLTANEVYETIKENDLTISANGSIFRPERGLIPEVLDLWIAERTEMKNRSYEASKKGDEALTEHYLMRSNMAKLANNSIYGAISNPYCRFYSIDLAASVTLTGQTIERYQCWKADQIVKEMV